MTFQRKNSGSIVALIGIVVILISIMAIIVGYVLNSDDVEIANSSDFLRKENESYQYRIEFDSTIDTITITLKSSTGSPMVVDVTVTDVHDNGLLSRKVTTPDSVKLDVTLLEKTDWIIILHLENGSTDMNDLDVRVMTDQLKESSMCLCCGGFLGSALSVILIITGIIISLSDRVKNENSRPVPGKDASERIASLKRPFVRNISDSDIEGREKKTVTDHVENLSHRYDENMKPRLAPRPPGFENDE